MFLCYRFQFFGSLCVVVCQVALFRFLGRGHGLWIGGVEICLYYAGSRFSLSYRLLGLTLGLFFLFRKGEVGE